MLGVLNNASSIENVGRHDEMHAQPAKSLAVIFDNIFTKLTFTSKLYQLSNGVHRRRIIKSMFT